MAPGERSEDEVTVKVLSTKLDALKDSIDKINLTLTGSDGRGGLVADVAKLQNCDQTKERFFDKYSTPIVAFVSAIVGAIVLVAAERLWR